MKCVFCERSVIGSSDAVSIDGGAPAHQNCYQFQLLSQRVFKNIQLKSLSDHELEELEDLVKQEKNSREESFEMVELF
ncbi:hypothetical protein GCM10022277_03860 [Litoribacillus peritrichatus]|uniref:DUF2175 domain-containing protein n=1 Tax=Litoribacillus peritrichatus TaxID=718191 RepID=A0ABP7M5C2_9GAMM